MAYMVFEGETYKEAFEQMYLVGAEQNILSQMSIVKKLEEEKKGFLGLGKKKVCKIIVNVLPEMVTDKQKKLRSREQETPDLFKTEEVANAVRPALVPKAKPVNVADRDSDYGLQGTKLENEVESLKNTVANLQELIQNQISDQISSLRETFLMKQMNTEIDEDKRIIQEVELSKKNLLWMEDYLRERDFSPALVTDILEYLKTQKKEVLTEKNRILTSVREFLKRSLVSQSISLDNYEFGNYVMFAGPTGVGKTITIVKLAAHIAAMRQKTMRFISIDRYKVGADSQLKSYAELLHAPFYTIHSQQEFFDLLGRKRPITPSSTRLVKAPANSTPSKNYRTG
jgi:flagellar biosynthesis GTPase FlhF